MNKSFSNFSLCFRNKTMQNKREKHIYASLVHITNIGIIDKVESQTHKAHSPQNITHILQN